MWSDQRLQPCHTQDETKQDLKYSSAQSDALTVIGNMINYEIVTSHLLIRGLFHKSFLMFYAKTKKSNFSLFKTTIILRTKD